MLLLGKTELKEMKTIKPTDTKTKGLINEEKCIEEVQREELPERLNT